MTEHMRNRRGDLPGDLDVHPPQTAIVVGLHEPPDPKPPGVHQSDALRFFAGDSGLKTELCHYEEASRHARGLETT